MFKKFDDKNVTDYEKNTRFGNSTASLMISSEQNDILMKKNQKVRS